MVARERDLQSDEDRRNTVSPLGLPCTRHVTHSLQDPVTDLMHISTTLQQLHISGWYWGAITAAQAKAVLQDASEGTFLVRDSSHPLYMLTLSVKTCRGPTSVRIEYNHGHFRLDSNCAARSRLLSFTSVSGLVQHYVSVGQTRGEAKPWEFAMPKDDAVLLVLRHPLRTPQAFPSLQHLARLVINRHTPSPAHLSLPRPLQLFLQEYPFHI